MKQYRELQVKVGFNRDPKLIFDELDSRLAELFRDGWQVDETVLDETLEYINIICFKDIEAEGRN